jgi:hypothetical protein
VALGAFVLTVLLGLGGAGAHALWQQSATATMSVTAAAAWPGPAFTAFTCTNDSPQKTATLAVTGASKPATLTYSALQPDGTYGPSYTEPVLGITNTVALTTASPIIVANRTATQLTIRVVATYTDQTQATGTAVVQLEQGNNSNKVTCISAST